MKQILFLIQVFLIAFSMALYPGETQIEDISGIDKINSINYTVINGSNDWFEVNYSGNQIFITPAYFLEPKEYQIEFTINGKKEVYVSTGSRGVSKKYYKWDCSEWKECIDGIANRTCKKVKVSKFEEENKPDEYIFCGVESKPIILEIDEREDINVEFPEEIENSNFKWKKWLIILGIIIGIVFLIIYYFKKDKNLEMGSKNE